MVFGFVGVKHALGGPKLPPSHRTRVLILAAVLLVLAGSVAPGTVPSHPPRPTRTPRFRAIGATATPVGGAWVQAADESFARPDVYEPDPEGNLGPATTDPGIALDPPSPWTARPGRAVLGERPGPSPPLRC